MSFLVNIQRAKWILLFPDLFNNPVSQEPEYRVYVVHHRPSLQLLDRHGKTAIQLTHCGLVMTWIFVNIGSVNGLVPDSTKPLPCSVRLADLIRTRNAMVFLFSLAEISLTRVLNRRDFWTRWRFVDQAMLIADLSTLSVMTWHQGKSIHSWEV